MVSPCSKISDSVAVVKDSDDPCLDFRHSMLQMISKLEIYSKDDLEQLLNCFLQLNSPTQHEIIVRALTEIWNEVVEDPTPEGVRLGKKRRGEKTGGDCGCWYCRVLANAFARRLCDA